MEILVDRVDGAVPIAVMTLEGDLDAATYQSVIDKGRELQAQGVRGIVVDLGGVRYLGSSGLVALHSLALLLAGSEPPDPESGWSAFHDLGLQVSGGAQQPHVKLVNPQPQVDRTLERTGIKRLFEVHPDRDSALASY